MRVLAEVDGPLPPIIVHHPSMQVVDGMHRLEAALLNGHSEIEVYYFFGDAEEMFQLAVAANTTHGLPLTQAERQAAAARVIDSHPQLSDRSIARITGLSAKTVARIRRASKEGGSDRRLGRDGRLHPLRTAEGRRIASSMITARPDASLREIAQEARISVGTVRDVRARLASGKDVVPPQQREPIEQDSLGLLDNGPDATQSACAQSPDTAFDRLRLDPTLRYSESGRNLLRWLGAHLVTMEQSRELLNSVPPHSAVVIARIARGCADVWRSLAAELEHRGGNHP
ncbi:ParB N-terminal domain-containing protein [Nonomuraea sp. NPDC051941]|uniref:ParB/RepB/Spo0J family partition protein n=1 Tax=Nonomuraea sp. NPDC051941 TaxID=3364373 RepID=UPI0037C64089